MLLAVLLFGLMINERYSYAQGQDGVQKVFDEIHAQIKETLSTKYLQVEIVPADPTTCPACRSEIVSGWSTCGPQLLKNTDLFIIASDTSDLPDIANVHKIQTTKNIDLDVAKGYLAIYYLDTLRIISHLGRGDAFNQDYTYLDSILYHHNEDSLKLREKVCEFSLPNPSKPYQVVADPIDTQGRMEVELLTLNQYYVVDSNARILDKCSEKDTTLEDSVYIQYNRILYSPGLTKLSSGVINTSSYDTVFYNQHVQGYRDRYFFVDSRTPAGMTRRLLTLPFLNLSPIITGSLILDPYTSDVYLISLDQSSTDKDTLYMLQPDGHIKKISGIAIVNRELGAACNNNFYFLDPAFKLRVVASDGKCSGVPLSYIDTSALPRRLVVMRNGNFAMIVWRNRHTYLVEYNSHGVRISKRRIRNEADVMAMGNQYYMVTRTTPTKYDVWRID